MYIKNKKVRQSFPGGHGDSYCALLMKDRGARVREAR